MLGAYVLVERPAPGLARIWSRDCGVQLWTAGKARKANECVACARQIRQGDIVWRPVTNLANRTDRICGACLLAASGA